MAEKKSFAKGCLIAVLVIIVLGIVFIGGCSCVVGSAVNEVAKQQEAETAQRKAAPVTNISWAEIDKIYNLQSGYTDLQKDEVWKKYEGKKIQWSGKVSSVGETLGMLSLQVKLSPETFTSDAIVYLEEDQKTMALGFKKDDPVSFQGILDRWGTLTPITIKHGIIVE